MAEADRGQRNSRTRFSPPSAFPGYLCQSEAYVCRHRDWCVNSFKNNDYFRTIGFDTGVWARQANVTIRIRRQNMAGALDWRAWRLRRWKRKRTESDGGIAKKRRFCLFRNLPGVLPLTTFCLRASCSNPNFWPRISLGGFAARFWSFRDPLTQGSLDSASG